MIVLVKITQLVGLFHRPFRGPGVLMRGEIDEGECQIPVPGFLHTFPIGVISPFLLDRELSCMLTGHGRRMKAEVLPLENQPGTVLSYLVNILVRMANEAGAQALDELPTLSLKQSNRLPPEPQPEAEQLDRLLELEFDGDSPEEEAPF